MKWLPFILFAGWAAAAQTNQVPLVWAPVAGEVAGYVVQVATNNALGAKVEAWRIDVGSQTNLTLDLPHGQIYYARVRAYPESGVLGVASKELGLVLTDPQSHLRMVLEGRVTTALAPGGPYTASPPATFDFYVPNDWTNRFFKITGRLRPAD